MKTPIISSLAALLALAAALLTPALAESAFTLTNIITLDTRGTGDLTVTGRVLNSQTKAPLAGATVTLAGLSTTTGSIGTFTLANVSLTSGTTLTASATGYLSQTRTVTAAAGVKAVNMGDLALAPNTSKAVVDSLKL
ncbi:MAG: carboxypeptidase regulatory-like domain-containing protein [Verrucomicrobia bacterium]|nr:carboxypeptidase regulatory-like domain-containing protein [Verrucomicrobiota bacterium]